MTQCFSLEWAPTEIRRVEECQNTGSEVVAVVTNDGRGFAKFLGNKEGPHVRACEFVGTRMDHYLGLPTFDHALMDYDGVPEIKLFKGNRAEIGSVWTVRREEGISWSGDVADLKLIENRHDIAKLVALDNWILNCDRFREDPPRRNLNNVFFSRKNAPLGQFRLVAMDHTHAFTCGRELKLEIGNISFVKHGLVFGWFPAFEGFITRKEMEQACAALLAVTNDDIYRTVFQIPKEWCVDQPIRCALVEFLSRRRDFVARELVSSKFPQAELNL